VAPAKSRRASGAANPTHILFAVPRDTGSLMVLHCGIATQAKLRAAAFAAHMYDGLGVSQ